MGYGWVSIHRQIQNHWLWDDKPFSFGQAWVDIILMANHADNKFPLGNEIVTVETGSFITSELKLVERWGWSKTKVRRFLLLLENDNMIIKKSDRKKTTITVVNYGDFQFCEPQKDQKNTTEKPLKDHKKTNKKPIKNTNNNDNNENNENNDNNENNMLYGEFNNVSLSDAELDKLKDKFPDYQERIEALSAYMKSKKKKYASHYATILSWARRDEKEQKEQKKKQEPKGRLDWIDDI